MYFFYSLIFCVIEYYPVSFFFFSSRRRHTRFDCDWSSDVCSSDLFTQVKRKWIPSDGLSRYRRGLYTYFWRASPHPALTAFDAPDAGTTCTRRNRSNTPLQALTLLNDAGFAEYAYGLASRLLREQPPNDIALVHRAFRICLSRHPTPAETDRLLGFLSRERQRYSSENAPTSD